MEWQPIETAPKDGTVIDLWMVNERGSGWRVPDAWWVQCRRDEFIQYKPDGSYTREFCVRDGWYAENHDYDNSPGWCDAPRHFNPHPLQMKYVFTEATHWMPLPPAPSSTQQGEGK